jgi:predicted O-methyltransferase YrrM
VLEIGTSNGYSTLWLADAVSATGGRLVTVDVDGERSAMAAANLGRAGLRELVELRVQDAALTLREAQDESVDLVFLDAERPAYAGYWPQLLRVLAPGGLLCVDNVHSHAAEVSELRELIAAERGVHEAVVPTGAGLLLVVRDPRPATSPPDAAAGSRS